MMLNALKCAYPPSRDFSLNRKYAIDVSIENNYPFADDKLNITENIKFVFQTVTAL